MPAITGRLEVNLSVRDPVSSARWYSKLLGMQQRYDHTSEDGGVRYICLEGREASSCYVSWVTSPTPARSSASSGRASTTSSSSPNGGRTCRSGPAASNVRIEKR